MCVVISLTVVLGVLRCQYRQKVNSVGHMTPKRVSQYTLGTGELNSVVVLSNAQPLDNRISIYYRVHEVLFYIPEGT